jgi:hypothetical protein
VPAAGQDAGSTRLRPQQLPPRLLLAARTFRCAPTLGRRGCAARARGGRAHQARLHLRPEAASPARVRRGFRNIRPTTLLPTRAHPNPAGPAQDAHPAPTTGTPRPATTLARRSNATGPSANDARAQVIDQAQTRSVKVVRRRPAEVDFPRKFSHPRIAHGQGVSCSPVPASVQPRQHHSELGVWSTVS